MFLYFKNDNSRYQKYAYVGTIVIVRRNQPHWRRQAASRLHFSFPDIRSVSARQMYAGATRTMDGAQ